MRAGLLRHRLTIESFSGSQDSLGYTDQGDTNWSTVTTVWGSVSPLRGNEVHRNDQQYADATHKIWIRAYDGLTTAHRFKFGSRVFGIIAILDTDERGIQQEIMVKEAV